MLSFHARRFYCADAVVVFDGWHVVLAADRNHRTLAAVHSMPRLKLKSVEQSEKHMIVIVWEILWKVSKMLRKKRVNRGSNRRQPPIGEKKENYMHLIKRPFEIWHNSNNNHGNNNISMVFFFFSFIHSSTIFHYIGRNLSSYTQQNRTHIKYFEILYLFLKKKRGQMANLRLWNHDHRRRWATYNNFHFHWSVIYSQIIFSHFNIFFFWVFQIFRCLPRKVNSDCRKCRIDLPLYKIFFLVSSKHQTHYHSIP